MAAIGSVHRSQHRLDISNGVFGREGARQPSQGHGSPDDVQETDHIMIRATQGRTSKEGSSTLDRA